LTLVDVETPEPDTDAMSDDPIESNPDLYKVAFENERVRVIEYRDAPGDRTTPHSHPDSVMVTLADFDRKLIMGDHEREMSLTAGRAVWIPAQSHAGENVGTTPSHSIFVELKEPDSSASTGSPPRPRTDRHWNESPMMQLVPFLLVGLGLVMILIVLISLP
jgi:quercetin dioxygenase-like cupin family protein